MKRKVLYKTANKIIKYFKRFKNKKLYITEIEVFLFFR